MTTTYPPPIRKTVAVCPNCFNDGSEWNYLPPDVAGNSVDCECERKDGALLKYVKRRLWFCGLADCPNEDEYGGRDLAYRTRADAEHPAHRIAYTDAPLGSHVIPRN